MNQNRELYEAKKEYIQLYQANRMKKEELIYYIKQNIPPRYTLLDILVYQMNLSSHEIHTLNDYNGLQTLKHIDDIVFEDTIQFFQSMNTVYLIFHERSKAKLDTRKVQLSKTKKKSRKWNITNIIQH